MKKLIANFLIAAVCVFGQYTIAPGGAAPADLDAGFTAMLEKSGTKLMKGDQQVAEIWFRAALPAAAKSSEPNISMGMVPHGTLLAVMKVDVVHADRRGQQVKPGTYTMRYSYFPENGDHQGASPQRDFMLLTPTRIDKDSTVVPNFDQIVDWSRKASGTPHPCVFSFWKEDPKMYKDGILDKQGEHDFVLMHKLGDIPVSIILVGKAEA